MTNQRNTDLSATDERTLIGLALKGDSKAFSRIVQLYQRPIYSLCYRYLQGGTECEDLAQETFIRAFVHREKFDADRPLLPWLMTIAKRLCIDHLRASKNAQKTTNVEEARLPNKEPDAERHLSAREDLKLLEQGLSELPEGQREAVTLYHMEGMSYGDMAETLEVPVGTVMTWLHRGRKTLRELVSHQGRAQGRSDAEGGVA